MTTFLRLMISVQFILAGLTIALAPMETTIGTFLMWGTAPIGLYFLDRCDAMDELEKEKT